MSDQEQSGETSISPSGIIRPLSVRMTDELRAQLEIIAQLNDRSVTEEVRVALDHWVETSKSDPKVLQRAAAVRAEIEREAATKRGAIEAIFAPAEAAPKRTSRSTKPD